MTRSRERRVVITGLGCISPVGNTVADAWNAVISGKSGIAAITKFDASAFSTHFAGEVKGFNVEEVSGRTITKSGAGLRNMKNRTNLIGGTFDIKTAPLQGTTISMSIPFNNDK